MNSLIPISLYLPPAWKTDYSQSDLGIMVARAPHALSLNISPTLTLLSTPTESFATQNWSPSERLEEQETVTDPALNNTMDNYRLVHLNSGENIGGDQAVLRLALHTVGGVPMTLQHYIAESRGFSVSISFVYPTQETPAWYPQIQNAVHAAQWKVGPTQ